MPIANSLSLSMIFQPLRRLASEIALEFEMMKGPERRIHRDVMRQVADMQQSLGK